MQITKNLQRSSAVIAVLFYGAFVFAIGAYEPNKRQEEGVRVIFFDVGQGDSALIQTPDKKNILIDGGPDWTVVYKLGEYLPYFERNIDLVIVSHPHADHLSGFLEVAKRYNIKKIIITGVAYETPETIEFEKVIAQTPEVSYVFGEKEIYFGDFRLLFLYPQEALMEKQIDNVNNASIVVKAEYENARVLFTGDLEIDGQEILLESNGVEAEIYKVPHHGSSDGLFAEFLNAVRPQIAVVSAGENSYGHPSLRTLRALERSGAKVLETGREGDIIIILKSGNHSLQTSAGRAESLDFQK